MRKSTGELKMSDTPLSRNTLIGECPDNTSGAITPQVMRDLILSIGFQQATVCAAATTTTLPTCTYSNGTSGIGATLIASSTGTVTLDGQLVVVNLLYFVKNQAAPEQNGVYICTTAGATGVANVFTRADNWCYPNDFTSQIAVVGAGSTLSGTAWFCNPSGAVTVGTTGLPFVQIGSSSLITAVTSANGLSLTGSTLSFSGAAYSPVAGSSSIVTVGPIATGTWHGTKIGLAYGGTNADLSATGGAGQYLKQASTGAVVTVGAIPAADITSALPTDYTSRQNWLSWTSTTSITIGTGSIYNPIDSKVETISSPIISSPTITSSTWYYVYLATGGASVVVSTSAPTRYQGTAWQDSSNRRYLGCFLTDASGNIFNFQKVGNRVRYRTNVNTALHQVLSAGAATSSTSVSCAGVIPATSTLGIINFVNLAGIDWNIGSSDGVTPTSGGAGDYEGGKGSSSIWPTAQVEANLNSSQAFLYCMAASGGQLYAKVIGFLEDL